MPRTVTTNPPGSGKSATAVDRHVGSRIRVRRNMRGLSQTELASALGITFQQVQKYEKGTNRIGAGRLYRVAEILGVPVQWFFKGLPAGSGAGPAHRKVDEDAARVTTFLSDRRAPDVVKNFMNLTPRLKDAIAELLSAVSADVGLSGHEKA